MSAEPQRTCPTCGNDLSGAMEFCPVCMLRAVWLNRKIRLAMLNEFWQHSTVGMILGSWFSAWWRHPILPEQAVFGGPFPAFAVERFAKVLQFLSGSVIIVHAIGVDRLQNWADSLKRARQQPRSRPIGQMIRRFRELMETEIGYPGIAERWASIAGKNGE